MNYRKLYMRTLYRLDDLAGLILNLLLLATVLAVAPVFRIWRLLRGRASQVPSQVLFLSTEGIRVAPARVRSYHFAEVMRRQGAETFVLAYWDEFEQLRHFPFPFRRIWEVEKFMLNLATLHWLALKGRIIIVEQRPNYGFIVPLYLKILNGSHLFMDIDDWILDYLVMRPFRRLEVRHMLYLFGLYCDDCIVSSRRLQQRLSRNFKRIHLLPTYVDDHRFTPPEMPKEGGSDVVFCWVGTIFQNFTRDNALFLIQAFVLACDNLGRRDGLRLEIVGGGDFFKEVQDHVLKRFPGYPIHLRPWMDPEAMPDYLRSIDVGLYSLVEPSLFQESKSPTKIFEYYASGKPVISTSFGEAKYFVQDGKTGILADTIEEFAAGMEKFFLEPELRIRMGAAGRLKVEQEWNMERACEELRRIVQSGHESV